MNPTGPEAQVDRWLDHYLDASRDVPVALGLSGGGDSVALLLLASQWARRRGRRLVILCVDHGLQPQSRAWTQACRQRAEALGWAFMDLAWEGEKPATGLQAAARLARHRLLAMASKAAGAAVLLLGHTADDRAEAAAMRASGAPTPEPRRWAPSPVWPQGEGLFLLRPLLDVTRAELRSWLASAGETWIEDPANTDLRYARARARLSGAGLSATAPARDVLRINLAQEATVGEAGQIQIARAAFEAAPPDEQRAFLAVACLSVSGGSRPPRSSQLDLAMAALTQPRAPGALSLAGARLDVAGPVLLLCREPGEFRRKGEPLLELKAGARETWDGRFEMGPLEMDCEIAPLAGRHGALDRNARRRIKGLPPPVRASLPCLLVKGKAAKEIHLPAPAEARSLTGRRLKAACGLIWSEQAALRSAEHD